MSEEQTGPTIHSPKTWMIVERLENWQVDEANDFQFFGIPDRLERRAREISRGDYFIVYVSSGISAFSDIRQATSSKLSRLRFGGNYDTPFPYRVETKPVLTLERKQWVPIKSMISELSFTRDKRDWRQVMRNALRTLSSHDASLINKKMTEAERYATQSVG